MDEIDGLAYQYNGIIKLYIPPKWKILNKERLKQFCQVLLHEIQHILYPEMPHHHMIPWNLDYVPYVPSIRIKRKPQTKAKPGTRGRKGR